MSRYRRSVVWTKVKWQVIQKLLRILGGLLVITGSSSGSALCKADRRTFEVVNGGSGWKNVVFSNHQIDLNGEVAIAMGSYLFTDATTDEEVKVEYTFGYKRCSDGKPRIFLHHSSVPYTTPGPQKAPLFTPYATSDPKKAPLFTPPPKDSQEA